MMDFQKPDIVNILTREGIELKIGVSTSGGCVLCTPKKLHHSKLTPKNKAFTASDVIKAGM
jgi:hypothetical protein